VSVTRDAVLACLKTLNDPVSGKDIVELGLVKALTVDDGAVRFVLEVNPSHADAYAKLRDEADAAVKALEGVASVSAVLTAHSKQAPPPDLKLGRKSEPAGPEKIPGVDRIIAIASGKGGVGKSTVAANLACALAAEGRRVGMLDADVYGPSQPRMLGVSGRPASPDGKTILPMRNFGVTMMSIGLMTNDDQAVVWRGPMLMGALQQLMGQVDWGELDVLIVDLPPGTGDVQLTLCQRTQLTGALVVSTPQDVALLDARKAIDMFNTLKTPVLGLIENMSTFICPHCGQESHPFGHGGVAVEAERLGIPFLGALPLDLDTRLAGDAGTPIAAGDSAQAQAFARLADRLVQGGMA
jgi:ATP-binding protein involved in chromosome partitioning